MENRGKLIVLSGPSGVGKSTVVAKTMEMRDDLCFSVSVTTRKPRPGETEGKDYFFISTEQFEHMVEKYMVGRSPGVDILLLGVVLFLHHPLHSVEG